MKNELEGTVDWLEAEIHLDTIRVTFKKIITRLEAMGYYSKNREDAAKELEARMTYYT